jgi:transposase
MFTAEKVEEIRLRSQANTFRALHRRAVQREEGLKEDVRLLQRSLEDKTAEAESYTRKIEKLESRVSWLEGQLFGRKSEREGRSKDARPQSVSTSESSGKRGKRRGTKGYGRKRRVDLPAEYVYHSLPEQEQRCPRCHERFRVLSSTEDSEQVHWEVKLVRRIDKRHRYRPGCTCGVAPTFMTAPLPAKIIPKGLFTTEFWSRVLIEKFLYQRPLSRLCRVLELEGLEVSEGTLTGGLARLSPFLSPIYERILERSRGAQHWHMDETRWMVYEQLEGKKGNRWWLWVVVTAEACAYILDPSRSSEVPKNFLGDSGGIVSADRYSAYKALENVKVAFCWSHVRRDFIKVRDNGPKSFRGWAASWVESIGHLFKLNRRRREADSRDFEKADRSLRKAIGSMAKRYERELKLKKRADMKRKALKSLERHWEGLTLFVDQPEIPMDNNEAERALRNPVIGRKNYYGSGSLWSGMMAVMAFSIFQTLLRSGVNPLHWLVSYLNVCAEAGGVPEDIEEHLPWNICESDPRVHARESPPEKMKAA